MVTLRCSICGKTYTSQWALDRHETIPHRECSVCGRFVPDLEVHMKTHRRHRRAPTS